MQSTWQISLAAMDEEEVEQQMGVSLVDDLLVAVADLPPVPPSFIALRFWRGFALDRGNPLHDHFCFVAPNGLCVVGARAWSLALVVHSQAMGDR